MPDERITDPVGSPDFNLVWSATAGTQTASMAYTTLAQLHMYEGELCDLDESGAGEGWGNLRLEWLHTNRVLVTTEGGGQFVAYMSDPAVDARLILDDYVPEIGVDTDAAG